MPYEIQRLRKRTRWGYLCLVVAGVLTYRFEVVGAALARWLPDGWLNVDVPLLELAVAPAALILSTALLGFWLLWHAYRIVYVPSLSKHRAAEP